MLRNSFLLLYGEKKNLSNKGRNLKKLVRDESIIVKITWRGNCPRWIIKDWWSNRNSRFCEHVPLLFSTLASWQVRYYPTEVENLAEDRLIGERVSLSLRFNYKVALRLFIFREEFTCHIMVSWSTIFGVIFRRLLNCVRSLFFFLLDINPCEVKAVNPIFLLKTLLSRPV